MDNDEFNQHELFRDEGYIDGEELNPITDFAEKPTRSNESSKSTLIGDQEADEENKLKLKTANKDEILAPDQFFDCFFKCEFAKHLRKIFLVSTNVRIHGPSFRSKYGVYQERARQLSSFPWIIHPNSVFIWYWDILVICLLIFTLVGQPILVTFYKETQHEYNNILAQGIASIIFFLDIVVNLRTGYLDKKSDKVILDYCLVARHYIRTWFLIDLLSSIPYDYIYVAVHADHTLTPEEEMSFKFLRLLELLKIFRLVRVIRYLTHIEEAFRIHNLYIRINNLMVLIFFTIHWVACVHYLVADLANPSNIEQKKNMSWVSRMNLWEEDVSVKYIHCVLRAVSNMVCLGYGNEVPKEMEDIVCTIVSVLLGALCFALFIGNVTSILLNVNISEKKYVEVLNQVLEYMRFKQIPKDLQNRVVLYYEQRYRRNFFNEQIILSSVSDVLREELQMCNCRRLVEEVPLFKDLPRKVLYGIVSRLKFEVYLPMDEIICANTIGDAMYFLEHGAVSILAPSGKVICRLQDGDFFGEMALITQERRVASVIATNFCDVYRLEKKDFHEAVEDYPDIYDSISAMAQKRAGFNKIRDDNANANVTELYPKPSQPIEIKIDIEDLKKDSTTRAY